MIPRTPRCSIDVQCNGTDGSQDRRPQPNRRIVRYFKGWVVRHEHTEHFGTAVPGRMSTTRHPRHLIVAASTTGDEVFLVSHLRTMTPFSRNIARCEAELRVL